MGNLTSVVIGDFDRERAQRHAALLSSSGFEPVICDNGNTVLETCRQNGAAACVLEVFLPGRHGFDILKALKEDALTADTRVLIILDSGDDYGEHRARICGVDSILRRPFPPEELPTAVNRALEAGHLATSGTAGGEPTEFAAVLDALEGRARAENPILQHITDPLTGLFNEAYTRLKLGEEFKKARRFQIPLACLVIGIDEAQGLSDPTMAPAVRGILNEIAGLLLCESRDIDHVARFQARDFILILPHTDQEGVTIMARRMLAAIEARALEMPGQPNLLHASAGIACTVGPELESAEELLTRAEEALRISKKWGGNRFTVWSLDPEATLKS